MPTGTVSPTAARCRCPCPCRLPLPLPAVAVAVAAAAGCRCWWRTAASFWQPINHSTAASRSGPVGGGGLAAV